MERIKDAVDKARQLRQNGTVATPSVPENTPQQTQSHEPMAELEALSYQKTQVVQLDPAHLEKSRIFALNKADPACWAIDLLRTKMLQKMDEHGWRTIGVVSPTPEAGKSVVSINLAISIAHSTQKSAMVVDFDLRRPKIGSYLGLPMEKSLNDVLDGTAEIADALVNPGIPRLVILPTARHVARSAELLASTKMASMVSELRERYSSRLVIFDLPPLLNVDDSIAILPKLDCILLVVGNGMSSEAELQETMRHLGQVNLLGVVLNKAESEAKPYYY